MRPRKTQERGAVFVLTLAILAGLTAIVATVAVSEQVAIDAETHSLQEKRARFAAEAGVQRALETLCDEGVSGTGSTLTNGNSGGTNANTKGATTLQDDWAVLGTTGNDRFVLKDSSFRLQIIDASSRINVNSATAAQLNNLPLDQEHVDALTDWVTAGETAKSDGGKDSYYNALANPYDASLMPMSTLSEIFDVRYFQPADIYDTPTMQGTGASTSLPDFPDGRTPVLAELLTTDSQSLTVNQNGTALTALSRINLQTIQRQPLLNPISTSLYNLRGSTTWAAVVRGVTPRMSSAQFTYLLNNYYVGTANPTGKINPNTATQAVLQTIPNLTQDIAQSIVNQQTTAIVQMGSILTVPGITTPTQAAGIIDAMSIKSNTFIVRVIGTVASVSIPLEAVVKITPVQGQSATAQIIRMEEQPFQDMVGRWGWQSTTTNDVTLEAGS